jgi:hypothetical protein
MPASFNPAIATFVDSTSHNLVLKLLYLAGIPKFAPHAFRPVAVTIVKHASILVRHVYIKL